MKKNVRVGILGCANIAEKYAIFAFQSLPGAELVAIASRNADKAQAWAQKYGLEPESYESLIMRKDIDIIYIPLPVGLQEEWTIRAAGAGKHLICEKSITYSFESAQRMVEVCKKNNVALYENFVPEFHPQHEKIHSLIAQGAIGAPHIWQGCYGFPSFPKGDIRLNTDLKGGSLNDCGCYTVFMARKILGTEPLAVTCTLSAEEGEVDTSGSALIEFPNGNALLAFGFDQLYQNTYTVWGSKGILRTNRAYAIPPTLAPHVELVTNDGAKEKVEAIAIPAANQFALSFAYFCNAVLRQDVKEIDLMRSHILQQARVMDAMRLSAREGKRVTLTS
jgi:NDP-hexose-3-ketoreductase